jgi:phage FluMu protein Com
MQCVKDDVTSEARCDCGHLVAKLLTSGVELKCKRCKRLVVIPYTTEIPHNSAARPSRA